MHMIDFHVHVFADEIAPAAIGSMLPTLEKMNFRNALDGTVGSLEASMRQCGIARAVYLPVATRSTQTETLIRWAAGLQQKNPMFSCMGTLHPNNPNYREMIALAKCLGLHGIKMHPVFQNFSVLDPAILDIFRICGEAGMIVVLHAGLEVMANSHADASPASLEKMLELCPGTTFVAAHMGGNRQWDEVERHLVGRRIYLDTSLASAFLGREQFIRIVRGHGADKILFASDSPWCGQQQAIDYVNSCDLTDNEKQRIFCENALRLLGKPAVGSAGGEA